MTFIRFTGDSAVLEKGRVYKASKSSLGYTVTIEGKNYAVLTEHAIEEPNYPFGKKDPINPSHYTGGGIEVWEMMVKLFGEESFATYCEINAFKYRMRAGKKEGNSADQDIKKALWYEDKLNEIKRKKKFG